MRLELSQGFFISEIGPQDKAAYVEHLNEKQIYDQTLAIPSPYTETDADWWINKVSEETKKHGRAVNFAIRREDGFLIGGIGFHELTLGQSHQAEIGYWLAKPYWNKGIMTEAVVRITQFGFEELNLIRITAGVFAFNKGSARVLEKAGFQFEGTLRKRYKKDNRVFDGKLYARITED